MTNDDVLKAALDLLREWTEEELTPRTDLHDRTEAFLEVVKKGPERIVAETLLKVYDERYDVKA